MPPTVARSRSLRRLAALGAAALGTTTLVAGLAGQPAAATPPTVDRMQGASGAS